jgi:hypothetical protein
MRSIEAWICNSADVRILNLFMSSGRLWSGERSWEQKPYSQFRGRKASVQMGGPTSRRYAQKWSRPKNGSRIMQARRTSGNSATSSAGFVRLEGRVQVDFAASGIG